MRASVPACTGRLAIAAGLAMALGAGLAPAAQAATAQPSSRIPAAAAVIRPHAVKLLYNQNNDAAGFMSSDNFGSGNSDNDQLADDFTVSKGQTWTISKVYVNTAYNNGWPTSVNVFFYKNAVNKKVGGNMPGALVKKETGPYKDVGGIFILSVTGVTLPAGHYWLSVQFNMKSGSASFLWWTRTAQNGSPAVYENPSNVTGLGCTTWYNMQTCAGRSGQPDLMFSLYGSSKN